jgi:initiation factor 1A
MVKNTTGGSKHKKQKNNVLKVTRKITLIEDENEFYGQISLFLGGNMVMVKKIGTSTEIRCKMRKRLPKISKSDIVLCSIREFGATQVGDVLLLYNAEEINILKRDNHIPRDTIVDDIFIQEKNENEEDEEELRNENKLKNELAIRDKRDNKENINENEDINIDNI